MSFLALFMIVYNLLTINALDYKLYKNDKRCLNVYNWGEYISDGSNGSIPVNRQFEKLTGIKINYSTFASNEELFAKLKIESSRYDIIIPSDYMISRMIKENMLEKLDLGQIVNYKNLNQAFLSPEYDPSNAYSIPYMWGLVGIIYNKQKIHENIDSWNDLWNPNYKGKILMFSNPRDCFGIALKKLGYSVNTLDQDQILKAADEIYKQKKLVQAYVMDEIFNKMENEEAFIAPYYSGDAITMMNENKNLAFVYPKEGTNKFVDAICIPKGSKNKDLAYLYINFLLEPHIALANARYVGYSTPNQKAFDLMDNSEKLNQIAYPNDDILNNTESFLYTSKDINKLLDLQWTKIMSVNNLDNKWLVPAFLVFGLLSSIAINIFRFVYKKQSLN